MQYQKGSVHMVAILGLIVALIVALGFTFWQNFMRADSSNNQQPVSKSEVKPQKNINDRSKSETQQATSTPVASAPVTKEAFNAAIPSGCMLGLNGGTFDINELTVVGPSNAAAGPLNYGEMGRINNDKNWAYLAGGCGSSAGAFLLKAENGSWKLAARHTGDAWFGCNKVDGLGIPKEVIGLCLDYSAGNAERAIR